MSSKALTPGFHPVRRDRLLQKPTQDAYRLKGKLPEPTVCTQCGAVFRSGRWICGDAPAKAHHETCAARHRINDDFLASFIDPGGAFFATQRERQGHPLKRLMAIQDGGGGALVTTSDVHFARAIGEAVHHADRGELEFHYKPDDKLLRVH